MLGYMESEIGGRAENQDSAGAQDTKLGTIVVVCDGMGGMNGGKTASMLAVQTIVDDVAAAETDASPQDVLKDAFKHAHEVLLDQAKKSPELKGMGTTATALLLSKRHAVIAHTGDSRVYQFRGRKKVFRTDDHSMVFQYVKAGNLTEEQARLSSQSNLILKALGVDCDITPDIAVVPYLKGDRFVLCTDGFWGALSERDFIRLITKKGNLENILWDATKEINKIGLMGGGGHDNLTAAIIDIKCESKIKPRMSKALKIILTTLVLLLASSVYINYTVFSKFKVASEFAEELNKNADTTSLSKSQKEFMAAFAEKKAPCKDAADEGGSEDKDTGKK